MLVAAVEAAQRGQREVRTLQEASPAVGQVMDARVHQLQPGDVVAGQRLADGDDEVDITVGVGIVQRERAAQVEPDELLREGLA